MIPADGHEFETLVAAVDRSGGRRSRTLETNIHRAKVAFGKKGNREGGRGGKQEGREGTVREGTVGEGKAREGKTGKKERK